MCFFPKYATFNFKNAHAEIKKGDVKIRFVSKEFYDLNKENCFTLPCGKCFECLRSHSIEWAYRVSLEASQYKDNCMITLTYKETNNELNKRDLQLFMKRLRKYLEPLKVRFFACGEYGDKGKRPHFHLILFNWWPPDAICYNKKKRLFGSQIVENIWKNGFISVEPVEFNNAKYCTLYLQKMQKCYNDFKVKPFLVMSRKPGIGYDYYNNNKTSILNNDGSFLNGKKYKAPRYFLKKFSDSLSSENLLNLLSFDKLKKYRDLKSSCFNEENNLARFNKFKSKFSKNLK